jgi:ubiquinone/menaquinone biosynthesis C-methylase UbiE
MKNRWDDILLQYNEEILELCPAHGSLRLINACEIKRFGVGRQKILDVGCGEGHSAESVFQKMNVHIDLLDISPEMIRRAEKRLAPFRDRADYICSDALQYLQICAPYDIIFSQYTIHNFTWPDKERLLRAIYEKLSPGGIFLCLDRIFPDDDARRVQAVQTKRYRYLSRHIRNAIVGHEKIDYTEDYRMGERRTIGSLKKIGFKRVKIIDRVERDALILAEKSARAKMQQKISR